MKPVRIRRGRQAPDACRSRVQALGRALQVAGRGHDLVRQHHCGSACATAPGRGRSRVSATGRRGHAPCATPRAGVGSASSSREHRESSGARCKARGLGGASRAVPRDPSHPAARRAVALGQWLLGHQCIRRALHVQRSGTETTPTHRLRHDARTPVSSAAAARSRDLGPDDRRQLPRVTDRAHGCTRVHRHDGAARAVGSAQRPRLMPAPTSRDAAPAAAGSRRSAGAPRTRDRSDSGAGDERSRVHAHSRAATRPVRATARATGRRSRAPRGSSRARARHPAPPRAHPAADACG